MCVHTRKSIQQYRLCHDAPTIKRQIKEIFSQLWTLLAERCRELWEGTERHAVRDAGGICSVLLLHVHVYTTLFRLCI